MVTGNEYIFNNIDEAMNYVLETEQRVLAQEHFSKRTVLMNKIDNPQMTLAEVDAEVRSLGFDLQDYVPHFTQEELDTYYNTVATDGLWEKFCGQIHISGDKGGQMMKTLLSLPQDPRYRWAFERDDNHVTEYEKGYVMRVYRDCLK